MTDGETVGASATFIELVKENQRLRELLRRCCFYLQAVKVPYEMVGFELFLKDLKEFK